MANSFGNRILSILVSSVIIIGFLVFLFFYIKHQFSVSRIEISDTGLVQKITSMGKLELVKYEMKDIIEQKEVHPILPDSRVLLLAVGEATACIDLTKVTKSDIKQGKDSVTVFLPEPEICYAKLDHEKSKIYDIKGVMFEDGAKDMVESVYKIAEKKILDDAKEMNVLGLARQNAQLIFKPLLEGVSGKTVILKFR